MEVCVGGAMELVGGQAVGSQACCSDWQTGWRAGAQAGCFTHAIKR